MTGRLEIAAARYRKRNEAAPPELQSLVAAKLHQELSGKGILAGEKLGDVVRRYCPDVPALAADRGFRLRLDLKENTHRNLLKGIWFFALDPLPVTRH